MSRRTKKQQKEAIVRLIYLLVVLMLSIFGAFSMGLIGRVLNSVFRVVFGQYPILFFGLIFLFTIAYILKPKELKKEPAKTWFGLTLLVFMFLITKAFPEDQTLVGMDIVRYYNGLIKPIFNDPNLFAYGGLLGAYGFGLTSFLVGRIGTIILNVFLGIVAMLLLIPFSKWKEMSNRFKVVFTKLNNMLKKLFKPAAEVVSEEVKYEEEIFVPEPLDHLEQTDKAIQARANFMDVDNEGEQIEIKPLKVEDNQFKLDLDESKKEVKPFDLSDESSFENYQLPPITLLEGGKRTNRSALNSNSAKEKGKRIIEVMSQFGIEAELLDIHIGPSVTKFEIKPDSNVKISKISSIQDNMMMELAVTSLRIEAPIPGRAAVGIEIPNVEMLPVRLREIIVNSKNFYDKDNIWVALGKNLLGEPITIALNKMPHLLIAGATGSGKSVCINSLISSILLSKHPKDLKLILIDPKKVEFTPYVRIPHLMGEVVTDPMEASVALKRVVAEMESRYETFSAEGVRNINGYNQKVKTDTTGKLKALPWIVVIIDELADLMAVAGKEVETSIQRITQLARAAGIHLVVATQRPSVDVVTGVIKANIPSRIAFAVSSAVDSRTILDATGAEKLLGYGDMLYIPMGEPSATRVQGVFVSDNEVSALTKYASDQAQPEFAEEFRNLTGDSNVISNERMDEEEYFEDAIEFVITNQRASTSSIQRQFRIGYNRAADIIDALEQIGVVGPPQGSRPREVLIQDMDAYYAQFKEEE